MKFSTAIENQLNQAVTIIQKGGLVAFPTETVYGLGANALNSNAVTKIFEVKNRPVFDPLIVHVGCMEESEALVESFPPVAKQLAAAFWPGPLTLVLYKKKIIPDIVTAGFPTVAIRVPSHPIALELIHRCQCPLAAPSANRFGKISPTTAQHVKKDLETSIELILDGGPCSIGIESTVLSCLQHPPVLLRPGGIPLEQIEKLLGPIHSQFEKTGLSPGQLPDHYMPTTPLYLGKSIPPFLVQKKIGFLGFNSIPVLDSFAAVELLSPKGILSEAAAHFFSALHRLDQGGLDAILAEPFPNVGLGMAINDRLYKAAQKQ
jgi:L-threonylcarbamoyladenylate synthase